MRGHRASVGGNGLGGSQLVGLIERKRLHHLHLLLLVYSTRSFPPPIVFFAKKFISLASNVFSFLFFLFILLDVYDNVEYLSSLGKAQTANVKRDAAVGVAQANRDAGIRVRVSRIRIECNHLHGLFLFCSFSHIIKKTTVAHTHIRHDQHKRHLCVAGSFLSLHFRFFLFTRVRVGRISFSVHQLLTKKNPSIVNCPAMVRWAWRDDNWWFIIFFSPLPLFFYHFVCLLNALDNRCSENFQVLGLIFLH